MLLLMSWPVYLLELLLELGQNFNFDWTTDYIHEKVKIVQMQDGDSTSWKQFPHHSLIWIQPKWPWPMLLLRPWPVLAGTGVGAWQELPCVCPVSFPSLWCWHHIAFCNGNQEKEMSEHIQKHPLKKGQLLNKDRTQMNITAHFCHF